MLLYYVRHGDPIYNPDSLTDLGQAQAEALKHRFADHGLDEIFSSTSNRAYQTALPTAKILKKEITQLDWCKESHAYADFCVTRADGSHEWCFHYGETVEKFLDPEVTALEYKWYDHPCFEGTRFKEGMLRIEREADEFLLSFGYRHDREKHVYIPEAPNDKRVALFAHEGFGMAFLSAVLDIPYPVLSTRFGISHSTVSVIQLDDNFGRGFCVPKLLQLSNDSHLFAERLPTKYANRFYI